MAIQRTLECLKEKEVDEYLFWTESTGEVVGQLEIEDFMVVKRLTRRIN